MIFGESRNPAAGVSVFSMIFILIFGVGLMVQFGLPRLMPSWHLGHGLFIGDAATTHEFAIRLLEKGPENGTASSESSLYIRFTAVMYRLTCPEPWVMLPWQALAQALAGFAFFQILRGAGIGPVGGWAGALWVGINPQAMEWATQLQKDGWFLAGNMLLLWGILSRELWPGFLRSLVGIGLAFFCRPPFLPILIFQVALLLAVAVVWPRAKAPFPLRRLSLAGLLGTIFFLNLARSWAPGPLVQVVRGHDYSQSIRPPQDGHETQQPTGFQTSFLGIVPGLEGLARQIHYLRNLGIGEGGRSLVDPEVALSSVRDQFLYVPRALWIGLTAPLPGKLNDWLKPDLPSAGNRPSFRMHPAGELTGWLRQLLPWWMLGCVLLLAGIGLGFDQPERRATCVTFLIFCLPVLILLAEITPNLGTLVRLRFPYWVPLTGWGLACWLQWWGDQKR